MIIIGPTVKIGLGPIQTLGLACSESCPMWGLDPAQSLDLVKSNVDIGLGPIQTLGLAYLETGPMWGLDLAQSIDWSRFDRGIMLGPTLASGLACTESVQCRDWTRSKVLIGPGPMWRLG